MIADLTWIIEAGRWLQQQPWLILALVVVPLLLLAWCIRSFPHLPLVLLALVPAVLTFALLGVGDVLVLVVVLDIALALIAAADAATLPARRLFVAERQAGRIASLKKSHCVTLTLTYRGRFGRVVWIRDDVPPGFEPKPDEFALRLARRSRVTVHYEMKANHRGAFQLSKVFLRVRSRLGLWRRIWNCRPKR